MPFSFVNCVRGNGAVQECGCSPSRIAVRTLVLSCVAISVSLSSQPNPAESELLFFFFWFGGNFEGSYIL